MNVLIEFFDEEPIENLITCTHFHMDKVICFGYKPIMTLEGRGKLKRSHKVLCGDHDMEFVEVPYGDLNEIVEIMDGVLAREYGAGNQCFFDLTGGGDLVLVAMGILSAKYPTPMHQFNVTTGKLNVIAQKDVKSISELAEHHEKQLTLDQVIRFYGGRIDYNAQKDYKSHLDDKSFKNDVMNMWKVASSDQRKWNGFSAFLRSCMNFQLTDLIVDVSAEDMKRMLKKTPGIRSLKEINQYLTMLGNCGVLQDVKVGQDGAYFAYKDYMTKDVIHDAGCILELYTYYNFKDSGRYSDVRVGAHIAWDDDTWYDGDNVKNEIDVLALEGNIPVFVSCKNGKVDQMALYELDTVAKRFGGRRAKKILCAGQKLSSGYAKRAEEMGIEVREMEEEHK